MNNLRLHRAKASLSQKELALLVGVSQPMIATIENNTKRPSLTNAQKIIAALNKNGAKCTINQVFPPNELKQAS